MELRKFIATTVREHLNEQRLLNEEIDNNLVLYHGSSHEFIKFSTKNIGGGEGNQSFGYGLYFTDNEGVAKFYANMLGGDDGIVYVVKTNSLTLFDWYGKLDIDTKSKLINNLKKININELPIKRMLVKNKVEIIKKPIEEAVDYYPNGKFLYENLSIIFGSDKLTSEKLSEIGFDGIFYPIGQFLKVGDKTHAKGTNYVLFSGDKINVINTYKIKK